MARNCEVLVHGTPCIRKHKAYGFCSYHLYQSRITRPFTVRGSVPELVRAAAWSETDECILLPAKSGRFSPRTVKMNGSIKSASRHVWIERFGDPGALLVLHRCSGGSGRNGCINPRHLYLGTDSDNTRDKVRAGRVKNARLTADDVRYIRSNAIPGTGGNIGALAARFDVGRGTIRGVVARRSWRHID